MVKQKRDCQSALSNVVQADRDVDFNVALTGVALFDETTAFANTNTGTDYASCPITSCVANTGTGTCTGGLGAFSSYISMTGTNPYSVVLH